MYHPKTDAYHFRYGDYQGKKTGGWDCELHGSDPHQARRSASLPREPDLRPKTGRPGLVDFALWRMSKEGGGGPAPDRRQRPGAPRRCSGDCQGYVGISGRSACHGRRAAGATKAGLQPEKLRTRPPADFGRVWKGAQAAGQMSDRYQYAEGRGLCLVLHASLDKITRTSWADADDVRSAGSGARHEEPR